MERIKNFEDFVNEGISALTNSSLELITLENPPGSNKGPEVETMQKNVGISPGDPWCAAFVYSFFKNANLPADMMKRIPRTGGVSRLWELSSNVKKITKEQALKNPELILPGMVFCYLSRNEAGQYPGSGHTGIVVSVNPNDKTITSIEGNTNPLDGAREGFGSFIVTRKIDDPSISKDPKEHPAKMLGFIDYLDGYRNNEDPEYKKFIDSIPNIISAYKKHTDSEINRIHTNPDLVNVYSNNYKNRNKIA
jgi:hypothetical protein